MGEKCKKHKHMEAKQYVLNNQEITEEIKEEIKYLETHENESTTIQTSMECSKSSSKKKVYSITILPREKKKNQFTPTQLEKKWAKLQISRRKEIIKSKADINEIETRNQ